MGLIKYDRHSSRSKASNEHKANCVQTVGSLGSVNLIKGQNIFPPDTDLILQRSELRRPKLFKSI